MAYMNYIIAKKAKVENKIKSIIKRPFKKNKKRQYI